MTSLEVATEENSEVFFILYVEYIILYFFA